MSAVDYNAKKVQRADAMAALRWQVKAACWFGGTSLLMAAGSVGWTVYRFEMNDRAGGSNAVAAVIDKCGQSYEFSTTRLADWEPDEGLFFDKLGTIVECTRGLQVPVRKGQSCWPKVYQALTPQTTRQLNDYLCEMSNQQPDRCDLNIAVTAMSRHNVEVTLMPGSSKSDDGRYRLAWREVERDTNTGNKVRDELWSGTFTVERVTPSPKAVAEGNAIGLRVTQFTWQRDKKQS